MKTTSRPVSRRGGLLFALFAIFIAGVPMASAVEIPFVPRQSSGWKYLVGATSEPPGWKTEGFNDSSWAGPAQMPIGYGDPGKVNTNVAAPGPPRPITMYFRKTFNVTAAQLFQINALEIEVRRDDGAVIHLNGVEIGRSNMPEGVITWGTTAVNTVGGDEERYFTIPVGVTVTEQALKEGLNVLALEIHQRNSSSSDSHGDVELIGREVSADYGRFTPTSSITFEDAFEGVFDYQRLMETQSDMDWSCTFPNAGVSGVYLFDPNDPEFLGTQFSSQVWTVFGGSSNFTSGRVDVRNYDGVTVSVDAHAVRYNNAAFNGSDKLKIFVSGSSDGAEFDKEYVVADLLPGSSVATNQVLIGSNDMKRVRVPEDNSEYQATPNWTELGFDDSSWLEGTKGAGFDLGQEFNSNIDLENLELRTVMHRNTASMYMRIPFTSPNPGAVNSLRLLVKYDDGYVAYINGTEVARKNAGDPGTVMTNQSTASATHNDTAAQQFETVEINEHIPLLVEGANNILAVHGLNRSAGSSDTLLLPELHIGIPPIPPTRLVDLAGPPNGAFFTFSINLPDEANLESIEIKANTTANAVGNTFPKQLFMDNIRVTGTPLSVDSYETWIALETTLEFDENGFPSFDGDFDSIINLLEYAFNSPPDIPGMTHPDSGKEILPRVERVGDKFRMTYRQLALPTTGSLSTGIGGFTVRDIKYIPQIGTPDRWFDGATSQSVADLIAIEDNDDGTVDVTVEFIQDLEFVDDIYVRLKVESVFELPEF